MKLHIERSKDDAYYTASYRVEATPLEREMIERAGLSDLLCFPAVRERSLKAATLADARFRAMAFAVASALSEWEGVQTILLGFIDPEEGDFVSG